jgi:DNA-binding beta-propeller fold protein YncE
LGQGICHVALGQPCKTGAFGDDGRPMKCFRTTRPQLGQALALGCGALLASCGGGPSGDGIGSAIFSEVRVIGGLGNGPGQFVKPRSIAVDRDDNVYVCDMTGRVQKFDPDGNYLLQWQMPETERGRPKGMALDHVGNIVVVEPHYSRINHFTTGGNLVSQWGTHGRERGELSFPRAVAFTPDGSAFVSEFQIVERLQKFGPVHESVQVEIRGAGHGPREFNRAEGLSLDATGKLYVADSCNHRVQVFDGDGAFLREHGGPGAASGEFSYPYDVRVDEQGRQYVCEFGNSRVTVLDADDQVLEIIGGAGSKQGQFNNPWSMALDSRGNLYVADSQNHRVQKLIRREPAKEFQLSSSPN